MDFLKSIDIWDEKSLIPSWSWLHGDFDSRPLGTWEAMIYGSVTYLAVLGVVSLFMRHRRNAKPPRPYSITPLVVLQNLIMAVYSLYVFWGTLLVLLEHYKQPGFWTKLVCDPEHVIVQSLDFWFYHFYLSKFFEWFDTIFLLLRAKPVFPPTNSQYFLHVFHHAVTPSIVWLAWRTPFSGAWFGPLSNGFVHVFMYTYYFLTELGMNRKYGGMFITPIQLVQFFMALGIAIVEVFSIPHCDTNVNSLAWMIFTYFVFLVFFLKLYFDKKSARNAPVTDAKKKVQ